LHSWVFQGNPDIFDINTYVQENENIVWSVRQKHLADRIQIHDEVFLWRASGRAGHTPGVIAQARIMWSV
jgi:hypothetical protein